MQELAVKNSKRAGIGDTVKIGLVQGIQYRGYLLAYTIPAAALVFGAAGGHVLGAYAVFPALDIIAGFSVLIAVSFFSLRRLKRLNSTSSIEIVDVTNGRAKPGTSSADEEAVPDYFTSYF